MTSKTPSISLIVPCKNEANSIPVFFKRVIAVCSELDCRFHIIAVDDGSADGTFEAWQRCANTHPEIPVRLIQLSRNFGKEIAISCGLQHCNSDASIIMDADLQDPPDLIPQMIKYWQAGFDTVIAIRKKRDSDSRIKRLTAGWFYALMHRIADVGLPSQAGDFRLLSRRLVKSLNAYPESSRLMKGLFATLGFKQKLIHYDRPERKQGTSSFSLWQLWNFALDGITSFSSLPLRVWSYIGFLLALSGMFYAGWIVVRTFIFGVDLPGYASLLVSVLFFAGIQLISIGILGEYVGRLFVEIKQRPLYLIQDSFGFDEQNKPGPLPPKL